MSKYPYWENRDIVKVVTIPLTMLVSEYLEDGIFYANSLTVVDAAGVSHDPKLLIQHTEESAKAGCGIYGSFRLETSPANPCTVSYTLGI